MNVELHYNNIFASSENEEFIHIHTFHNDFFIYQADPDIPEEINTLLEKIKTGFLARDMELIQSLFQRQTIIQTSGETPFGNFTSESESYLSEVPYESFIQAIETGNWQEIEMQDIKVIQHPRISELYGVQFTTSFHSENVVDNAYVFHLIEMDDENEISSILMSIWQQLETTKDYERFELDDVEIL